MSKAPFTENVFHWKKLLINLSVWPFAMVGMNYLYSHWSKLTYFEQYWPLPIIKFFRKCILIVFYWIFLPEFQYSCLEQIFNEVAIIILKLYKLTQFHLQACLQSFQKKIKFNLSIKINLINKGQQICYFQLMKYILMKYQNKLGLSWANFSHIWGWQFKNILW